MELNELERQVRSALESQLGRPMTHAEWEAVKRQAQAQAADPSLPGTLPGVSTKRARHPFRVIGKVLLSSLIYGAFLALWVLGPFLIARAFGVGPGEEGPIDWGSVIFVAWFVFIVPVYWIYRAMAAGPWTKSEWKVLGWAVGFAIASPAAGGAALLIVGGSGVRIAFGVLVALVGAVVSIFAGLVIAMTEENRALFRQFRRY